MIARPVEGDGVADYRPAMGVRGRGFGWQARPPRAWTRLQARR